MGLEGTRGTKGDKSLDGYFIILRGEWNAEFKSAICVTCTEPAKVSADKPIPPKKQYLQDMAKAIKLVIIGA